MSDKHQLHVPGCALRAAVLEGPKEGEGLDPWAKRVTFTRCTCRKALAGLIAVVLRPFAGQRLTPELLTSMRETVAEWMAKTASRYGDAGWQVSLTERDGNVDVHLIPPAALEVLAGEPEPKLVPTISTPAAEVPRALEGQRPFDIHAATCDVCKEIPPVPGSSVSTWATCDEGEDLLQLEMTADHTHS